MGLCPPASAGRLGEVLLRGPVPHLQGFVLRQRTGNATAGAWSEPVVTDWDGDGDEDILAGSGYGDLFYFQRRADGLLEEPVQMMPEPLSLITEPLQPNPISPACVDWDGDGLVDIVIGMRERVYLFRRTQSGVDPPVELLVNGDALGTVVRRASPACGHLAPCAADLDLDGDPDLLLGDDEGHVWWVANEGSTTQAVLAAPNYLAAGGRAINVGSRARVTVGDWNADGYPDLLIGNAAGNVYLCQGTSTGPDLPRPIYGDGAGAPGSDEEAARDLAPSFSYWHGTGSAPRLIVGGRHGFIAVVASDDEGQGRLEGYLQAMNAPVDAGRCATAFAVDWDGDGDDDLVTGGEDGYVRLFDRIEKSPPVFASGRLIVDASGPVRAAAREGCPEHLRYSSPCIADIDSDRDLDLLVGQANGQISIWLNNRGFKPIRDIEVAGSTLALSGMSTVHAFDYDQDGDTDVFPGTRLIPNSVVQSNLAAETVLYLENVANKPKHPPLFIKAVRLDTFLVPKNGGTAATDADTLGISSAQPFHWNRDGLLDFVVGSRFGAYVFRSGQSRNSYPRLEFTTAAEGIPAPLVPLSWSALAARVDGPVPGMLCGMAECGWVVWYPRENIIGASPYVMR